MTDLGRDSCPAWEEAARAGGCTPREARCAWMHHVCLLGRRIRGARLRFGAVRPHKGRGKGPGMDLSSPPPGKAEWLASDECASLTLLSPGLGVFTVPYARWIAAWRARAALALRAREAHRRVDLRYRNMRNARERAERDAGDRLLGLGGTRKSI